MLSYLFIFYQFSQNRCCSISSISSICLRMGMFFFNSLLCGTRIHLDPFVCFQPFIPSETGRNTRRAGSTGWRLVETVGRRVLLEKSRIPGYHVK